MKEVTDAINVSYHIYEKRYECGDLSTIYDTSYAYLGRVYLGPCQSHLKYIDYYRRIFKIFYKENKNIYFCVPTLID